MDDLIKALQIFRKYGNPSRPTHCEHDQLTVCVSPSLVSEDDLKILKSLSFHADESGYSFYSFRFGSA